MDVDRVWNRIHLLSHFALAFALMPQIALGLPAIYLLRSESPVLVYFFGLLATLYLVALITIRCGGVLLFFMFRSTTGTLIPVLIWSYGVALGPWEYMASKEVQGGGGEAAAAITFFAQIGYVLMIVMVLLLEVRVIDVLSAFVSVMFLSLIFQLVLSVQKNHAERLLSGYIV